MIKSENKTKPVKIAVLTDDDPVWLMPFWAQVHEQRKGEIDIVCLITLPPRLVGMNSRESATWSLRTFGLIPSVLLGIYYFKRWSESRFHVSNFESTVPTLKLLNLRKNLILEFFEAIDFDYVFISTSKVIPADLLFESHKIWLNKHASLLPNYRGVYPFIWAGLNSSEQGYSVHVVTPKVDAGPVIFQKVINDYKSMVDFYVKVNASLFKNLSEILRLPIEKVLEEQKVESAASSYPLPSKYEIRKLRKRGLKIIRILDLL